VSVSCETPKAAESEEVEQKMVEEALRLSLSEDSVSVSTSPAPVSAPVATVAATPSAPVANATYAPFVPSPSKPALRFICDVTFPDGTKVHRGAKIVKIWRVRNDGDCAWPAGSCITTAGGDLFTPYEMKSPVPLAAPGEEVEIALPLEVPQFIGRFIAYFRLQTKEGTNFGQRLWADIRVVDDEQGGWQVVSTPSSPAEEQVADVKEIAVAASPLVEEPQEEIAKPVDAVASTSKSPAEVAEDVWSRVWGAELEVLAAMGFNDRKVLVPLLQEHVKTPVSVNKSNPSAIPDPEGMQHVVLQLLSQSLVL